MNEMRYWLCLFGLNVLLASCQGSAVETAAPSGTSSTTEQGTVAQAEMPSAMEVPTQTLVPERITIALDDLPQPFASESASKSPNVINRPVDASLNVPEGFTVNVFAEGLQKPRWLALTPEGDVLVTETRENRIQRLIDSDGDGVAEGKETFASARNGLNIPFGMAFAAGAFFLGNTDEVRRFPFEAGQSALEGEGDRIATLPGGGYNQHWTRNVVVSPDGDQLYVSVGSKSNVSEESLPRASVQTMGLDGSNMRTFASGLRNPVGLDFHPTTGELYTTVLFQSHSAALGLQFYDGGTFPERYRNRAFAAFRGSWNRSAGTGYKIVFVPFDEAGRPAGGYEDFLTGFLVNPSGPTTWGRPVGLLVMPDGSLLVTEEANGVIYRTQYEENV